MYLIRKITATLCLLPVITIVFVPSAVAQQNEKPQLEKVRRPFLWKIENEKNPDKPSYLFGTIHVTDPRVLKLHPLAQKAFDDADTLFLEMKPDDAFKQLKPLTLPEDIKLADQIDAETLARLDAQLALINPIFAGRHRPNYKVWVWPIIIPSLKAQLKNTHQQVLDYELAMRATHSGKPMGSLEDPSNQLSGMEALSLPEQLEFLKDALTTMEEREKDGDDMEAELTEIYLGGSIRDLKALMDEDMEGDGMSKELTEKLMDAMLYSRNQRMADTIVRALEKHSDKSHFFAAGTAHFAGDKSVQQALKKAGLKVTRVKPVKQIKDGTKKKEDDSKAKKKPESKLEPATVE